MYWWNETNQLNYTPPNWHIAPENVPSQKETHPPTIIFQRQTVSFREGKYQKTCIKVIHQDIYKVYQYILIE